MILFLSFSILGIGFAPPANAQQLSAETEHQGSASGKYNNFGRESNLENVSDTTETVITPGLPDPMDVMYKSMMVPGWGQIVNKQAWKVPIVYGLLGGLGWYSAYLTQRYHDYRAAYYNLNPDNPADDLRFGATPSYIPDGTSPEQLRNVRNTYRNRRDLVYVGIFVAYGLNIVDAYVFAHMRSFDVSEDLSMRTKIQPTLTAEATPGISLSIDLISK